MEIQIPQCIRFRQKMKGHFTNEILVLVKPLEGCNSPRAHMSKRALIQVEEI